LNLKLLIITLATFQQEGERMICAFRPDAYRFYCPGKSGANRSELPGADPRAAFDPVAPSTGSPEDVAKTIRDAAEHNGVRGPAEFEGKAERTRTEPPPKKTRWSFTNGQHRKSRHLPLKYQTGPVVTGPIAFACQY
jgi:hypothetical protein